MPKALTALGVDRLGVKKKLYIRRVDDNLYIKVMPTSRKYWLFRYVMPGGKNGNNLSLGELTPTNDYSTATARLLITVNGSRRASTLPYQRRTRIATHCKKCTASLSRKVLIVPESH